MANITYTATANLKSFSSWTTSNVNQSSSTWNSSTGEGVLVLNSGVTSIGGTAFWGCTALTSINIPDSITSIGGSAFENCTNLTSIDIPSSVTSTGNYVFSGCTGLTSINIPSSVTSIGNSAFYGCTALTSITIPGSVTSIGTQAFDGCSNLKDVTCLATTPPTLSSNNFTTTGDTLYVPSSSVSTYKSNTSWKSAFTTITSIPVKINYTATANLKSYSTWLTNNVNQSSSTWNSSTGEGVLVLKSGVTSIGSYAFDSCTALTSITIPDSITSIGGRAFEGCSGLTSITVNSNNTTYDSRNNCNGIIKKSDNSLVVGCKNTIIPDTVTSIAAYAFIGCSSLTSITIPDSITSIGGQAFDGCTSLTSITIPNTVTSIGYSAFSSCSGLTSITIPSSVTSIGRDAFRNCTSLTSITIPNTVTSIGNFTFYGCSGLTSITIPSSVTNIESSAFDGCSNLLDVTCLATTPPTLSSNNFTTTGDTLYVPLSAVSSYQSNTSWNSAFTTITSIPTITYTASADLKAFSTWTTNNVNQSASTWDSSTGEGTLVLNSGGISIGSGAFRNCTALTSINIPDSVTSIDSGAFQNCSALTSITIPNLVTSIANYTFERCSSLTSITIPDSVTSIGSSAFQNCSALTSITIPDSVTSIGTFAFASCTGLTSITIPDSVTSIGNYTFNECSGLTSITVDSNNTVYDSRNNCNAIIETSTNTLISGCNNTIIPNTVTSIGNSAFLGRSGLTSITIPDSVTSIEYAAFSYCSNLLDVTCLATTPPTLGSSNFGATSDTLYVPSSAVSTYQANTSWNNKFTYIKAIYSISVSITGNGTVTGPSTAIEGDTVSYTITPTSGYRIVSIVDNGVSQTITNPLGMTYTISNIAANHTISVEFEVIKYTVTATATTGGTITPNGAIEVVEGDNLTFTIAPNTHYSIKDVLVDSVSVGVVSTYTFSNVTANHTISVEFEAIKYTVTATATSGGTITPSGAVEVVEGDNLTFTIAPNTHYSIKDVLVDSVSVGVVSTYTFSNVTANHTISVEFEAIKYTVTATATTGGTITPSGAVEVVEGDNLTFTIAPNTHYSIKDVLVDSVSVGVVSTYTFSNVSANHTISVEFEAIKYTVTATATTGGTITPSGEIEVVEGDNLTFTIAPNAGYNIVSVTDNGTSVQVTPSGMTYTISNIVADHTIAVVFAALYTVSTTTTEGGTISPSSSTIVAGSDVTLTITPNAGYGIFSVTDNGTSVPVTRTGMTYTISNIAADHTIAVVFKPLFTITTSAGEGGSITPTMIVMQNEDATIVITPTAGYSVSHVYVDGADQGSIMNYSFQNVVSNHTVTAEFVALYTVSTTTTEGGTVSPESSTVAAGSNVTLTITPNAGYSIVSVTDNGTSVQVTPSGMTYTISNIQENHTVAVVFTALYVVSASTTEGGTITPSGAVEVLEGGNLTFTITPNTHYFIKDVLVDSVSVGVVSTYTFSNVTANHTISVEFEAIKYTVTASATTGGTITPNGAIEVVEGDNLTFTIAPNTHYSIKDVLVDSVSVGVVSTYTFSNVTANHTISVEFEAIKYTVTATATIGGTITPSGEIEVVEGDNLTFTIAPNTQYFIKDVLVDSVSVGAVSTYTFSNIQDNHTVEAIFMVAQNYGFDLSEMIDTDFIIQTLDELEGRK